MLSRFIQPRCISRILDCCHPIDSEFWNWNLLTIVMNEIYETHFFSLKIEMSVLLKNSPSTWSVPESRLSFLSTGRHHHDQITCGLTTRLIYMWFIFSPSPLLSYHPARSRADTTTLTGTVRASRYNSERFVVHSHRSNGSIHQCLRHQLTAITSKEKPGMMVEACCLEPTLWGQFHQKTW